MMLGDELERQALVIGLAARDDALAEDCNDQIGAFNAGALAFLTALRSAEPKAPADVSGLVERIVLEHSDYTGGQGLYSAQKVREILTHALAARDAEIELLKGVAEKAMDAAMANARDEYRALYSTTIDALKQEIGEAREVIENIADETNYAPSPYGVAANRLARAFLARQETNDADE